ncbi:MAG: hypothetical protein HYX24_02495 [Candidatus Aenigmarchaeota archaeon]|nr:hypothetical protein [Candidatus Aenigmarchaeota archaeon]
MVSDKVDFALRILAWGIIGTVVAVVLLKALGVIHSPADISLDTLLTGAVLIELGRIEAKLSLLWQDFKKRKKV